MDSIFKLIEFFGGAFVAFGAVQAVKTYFGMG